MIVRMSAWADASMTVLTGYPIRNCTPSRFRISATAAAPFMDTLLGTGVASARADDSTPSAGRRGATGVRGVPSPSAREAHGPARARRAHAILPRRTVLDWLLP